MASPMKWDAPDTMSRTTTPSDVPAFSPWLSAARSTEGRLLLWVGALGALGSVSEALLFKSFEYLGLKVPPHWNALIWLVPTAIAATRAAYSQLLKSSTTTGRSMHLNSDLLFKKYLVKYFDSTSKVLEIGPAGYPSHYYKAVNLSGIEWHTLDISSSHSAGGHENPLHIVSKDEYHYPINDEQFDIVLSGQVMEHVKKIWLWIDELKRVTRKNGLIIVISPISWTYHEFPVDCWRIYPDGNACFA